MAAEMAAEVPATSHASLEEGFGRKPRSPRRAAFARSVAVGVLAAVAVSSHLNGQEAFTGLSAGASKAGPFMISETEPRGMVCREAYGEREDPEDGRWEWDPLVQWRGEKSFHPIRKLQADSNRQWYHFDAEGKTLGHLSQHISNTLRGKHSPLYDPIADVGAFVVVTNCEKVRVSWKKYHYKLYFRTFQRKIGDVKVERFKDLQRRFPERIIMKAVWGSMPKTPSSRRIFKDRLKLFAGPNHLYYNMDPLEYPMHLVKDCTRESNMRTKDRAVHQITKKLPAVVAVQEARQEKMKLQKLKKYKTFLYQQYLRDKEAGMDVDGMSRSDLEERANQQRMTDRLARWGDNPLPKSPVKYYMGTNIVKRRISGHRDSGKPPIKMD